MTIDHMISRQSTHPFNNYMSSIHSLRQRAANISHRAQLALQQTDARYYDQMKSLVLRPWKYSKEFESVAVNADLRWPIDRNKANTGN